MGDRVAEVKDPAELVNALKVGYASSPRQIADGIWWIPACNVSIREGKPAHLHLSAFLILGSEKTLLYDTSAPHLWPGIEESMEKILDGRTLDYLAPSHPEIAHFANAPAILDKHPEALLVGDMRDYSLYWPEYEDRMVEYLIGSTIDLGDRSFKFVDAVIKDLPSTQWGYEASQQVLFVGDGFAYSHRPPIEGDDIPTHIDGECTLLATELPGKPGPEQVVWITKAALYWTRFVKMDVFREPFEKLLAEHPTRLVAPAHGAVIDDPSILWLIWDALMQSYSPEQGIKTAGVKSSQPTSS